MRDPTQQRFGIVLTGGGARAAYQVGVLRAISAITNFPTNPFRVISGYSAGAINGTWLAGRTENFERAVQSMWDEWSLLTSEKVFNTDVPNVVYMAMRWIKDRSLGGVHHNRKQINYLLDTVPLQKFIESRINYQGLREHLSTGALHGISVTTVNYQTGQSVSFYGGSEKIEDWKRLNRISVRTELGPEHVIASSAIPIFFPPKKIGNYHYGDGMVRLNAPLSAAIKLGAEKLLVIGIRGPSAQSMNEHDDNGHVTLGEIAGTILNGLFFDSLDADLARLARVNRTVALMSVEELSRAEDHLRHIPVLVVKPSEEIGRLSECELSRLPPALKFLLKGIGLKEDRGTDLLSYLSFEPRYIKNLLEAGYEDTMKRKDEIIEFFS
jgi:NTE family protein